MATMVSKRYDAAAAQDRTRQAVLARRGDRRPQGDAGGEVRRVGGPVVPARRRSQARRPDGARRGGAARTASARPCGWRCSPRARRSARRARPGPTSIGAEDLVERVQGGWMDFDTAIATPDLMGQVGRLGKVLGPRGLMPNPKLGTVTFDVSRAVREAKAGKVEFRVDKAGNIHTPVGKRSFNDAAAARQRDGADRGDRAGEAVGGQGDLSPVADGVEHDEPGRARSTRWRSRTCSRRRRPRGQERPCLRKRRSRRSRS